MPTTKPQAESEEDQPMSMQDQMIQNLEAINATQAARLDVDMARIAELEALVGDIETVIDDQAERIRDDRQKAETILTRLMDRDKHILALERIIRLQDDALDKLGTQLHFLQEGRH